MKHQNINQFYLNKQMNAFAFQMHVLDVYENLFDRICSKVPHDVPWYCVMDQGIYSAQVFLMFYRKKNIKKIYIKNKL